MNKEFRKYLKGLRLEKGLTLRQVTKICGLSVSAISGLERGTTTFIRPKTLDDERFPNDPLLRDLYCEGYKKGLEDLLELDKEHGIR